MIYEIIFCKISQLATRNSQLATRNSQLATRNSQLATRNSQLATAIVLSSAFLLTACEAGSSDSSGGKYDPNATIGSKTSALKGYWRSACQSFGSTSLKAFMQVRENRYGELIYKDAFYGEYQGAVCRGKPTYLHFENIPFKKGKPVSGVEDITFYGKNQITIPVNNRDWTFNRYRASLTFFPKYRYTNPVD